MKITFRVSEKDNSWLKELRKYAYDNHWSVSLAIRELLSKYFEATPVVKKSIPAQIINVEPEIETKKIDPDTYFAQIESKLVKPETSDIDKQLTECIKEMTNSNGEVSCYFFDNAREKHSFCKQYCWTNEKIWGKRVRL